MEGAKVFKCGAFSSPHVDCRIAELVLFSSSTLA
jgi:hypothetical protein